MYINARTKRKHFDSITFIQYAVVIWKSGTQYVGWRKCVLKRQREERLFLFNKMHRSIEMMWTFSVANIPLLEIEPFVLRPRTANGKWKTRHWPALSIEYLIYGCLICKITINSGWPIFFPLLVFPFFSIALELIVAKIYSEWISSCPPTTKNGQSSAVFFFSAHVSHQIISGRK